MNQPSVIGKWALVRDTKIEPKTCIGAMVIDHIFGTNDPKRIRLQTGEHAGEVRGLGEYELMEFIELPCQ